MKYRKMSKMKFAATLQAAISALFITCMFLPCVELDDHFCSDDLLGIPLIGLVDDFIILLLLHIANIFLQAHGSCRLFSAISSIISFVILGVSYSNFEYKIGARFDPRFCVADFELMFTFYLAIALLLALLIVPTLIVKSGNAGQELKESDNIQDSIVDTK